jgi:SpoIID/LytB domain protein
MAANGEICDTQRCQVYKGVNGEFPGQIDAVNTTLGTTLEFGGRYASAVFSANAAGFSATPQEGFGTSNESHPYLVATPYATRSPDPWQVRIGLADLARRLGYPGAATGARVATTGPSGRPLAIEIDGDRGPMRYSAHEADSAMGLRSTMWEMRIELADVAPEAPDAVALIQAPPDEVGAAIAKETEIAIRASTSSDRAARRATTTLVAGATTHDARRGAGDSAWLLVVPVVLAGLYGAVELRRHHARSGTGADG